MKRIKQIANNNNLLALMVLPLILESTISPINAQIEPLRVGILNGSLPCSAYENGSWKGLVVGLWDRVAQKTKQTYKLVPMKDISSLLNATQKGELDVGIGCIHITPDRIGKYIFTVPFKEGGFASLSLKKKVDIAKAIIESIFSQYLIDLMLIFISVMASLTAILYWVEKKDGVGEIITHQETPRFISIIFAGLLTGSGADKCARTKRGNSILVLAYLVRLVFASLIVSYITANIINQNQKIENKIIIVPTDLSGLKVAAKREGISEDLLKQTNQKLFQYGQTPIVIVPTAGTKESFNLLLNSKVDAIIGDNAVLLYFKRNSKNPKNLILGMQKTLIQSQAFTISPKLPLKTQIAINSAIAELKENNAVDDLEKAWLGDEDNNKNIN